MAPTANSRVLRSTAYVEEAQLTRSQPRHSLLLTTHHVLGRLRGGGAALRGERGGLGEGACAACAEQDANPNPNPNPKPNLNPNPNPKRKPNPKPNPDPNPNPNPNPDQVR